MNACIIIPSHISHISRINLLMNSLTSLEQQTYKIPVYLSISFETPTFQQIFEKTLKTRNINQETNNTFIQNAKTPQYRHIEILYKKLRKEYKWFFFCDDDDTYNPSRVHVFMNYIQALDLTQDPTLKNKNPLFAGIYESQDKKTHQEQYYEYWSYCVHTNILDRFYKDIYNYDESLLDHVLCDIVFATYLRKLPPTFVFVPIPENNYNYIRNEKSMTGIVKTLNQSKENPQHREKSHIDDLNDHYKNNLHHLSNSMFMLALWDYTFEDALQKIFTPSTTSNRIHIEIIESLRTVYDRLIGFMHLPESASLDYMCPEN